MFWWKCVIYQFILIKLDISWRLFSYWFLPSSHWFTSILFVAYKPIFRNMVLIVFYLHANSLDFCIENPILCSITRWIVHDLDSSFINGINTSLTSSMEINVRENRRSNQEWTIRRHWQHWTHKTQGKDK